MSRSAVFALLVVLVPVPGVVVAAETTATTLLQKGDDALQKFDVQTAVDAYREARHTAPDNYEAAWKFARALADKATLSQNHDEQRQLCIDAERSARDAVRLNPNDAKGHTCLAITVGKLALYEGGKRKVELSKEVKTEAEAALKLNPDEDIAHHVLGVWNREMVELNWILKKFAEFLYGKFPPASLDEAVAQLRRATELAPNVVAHHVELGLTLIAADKCPEGQKELADAVTMPKTWVTDEYYRDIAKRNRRRC